MSEESTASFKSMLVGDDDRDEDGDAELKDERGSRVFCGDGNENDRSSNSCLIFLSIWRISAARRFGDGGEERLGAVDTALVAAPVFCNAAAILATCWRRVNFSCSTAKSLCFSM